ncbi:MAG: Calx-beta domain-containing protein, partial [Myxococcota bacterium]
MLLALTGCVARSSLDVPQRPLATLSVEDATAVEGVGEIVFRVALSRASIADVTFSFATQDATPVSADASDYVTTSGDSVVPAGEIEALIVVALVNDAASEGPESFELHLSNIAGALANRTTASGTIDDDDVVPALSVEDATALEGSGEIVFRVALSQASVADVTFSYATQDATPVSADASDYVATNGDGVVPAGEVEVWLAVPLLDDGVSEGDETLVLQLSNVAGALSD